MAAKSTDFLPDYPLRFNFSGVKFLCKELGIERVDDILEFVQTKMKSTDIEKIIYAGLRGKHPELTLEDLTKEGGLLDQFTDLDGENGFGDIGEVALQSLFDSGILARAGPNQVADTGEGRTQPSMNG
jgi:hypothetical protein